MADTKKKQASLSKKSAAEVEKLIDRLGDLERNRIVKMEVKSPSGTPRLVVTYEPPAPG